MPVLLAVFFLSGATALAYQIIWIRLFVIVFGGTVVSMSVVVSAFMAGLALGSRVFGAYAERVGNRVRLYGFLELALGVLALAVFFGIRYLSTLVYALPAGMNADSAAGVLVRLIMSFAMLIGPTMIMGGTLPVLVRAVTGEKKQIMRNTGLLYAFNTLGAMTGAFLVGFVLIRHLGLTLSTLAAVLVNLALGAIALLVCGRFASTPDTVPIGEKKETRRLSFARGKRFLAALTVTGFVGLALEMIWMRMLLLTINNTIYLYTIAITAILFGLGLGGLLMPGIISQRARNERTFGLILAGIALTVLIGFLLLPVTTAFGFSSFAFYRTWIRISLLSFVLFLCLGFVPSLLMGMSLPIGVGLYANEVRGLSRRVGVIYAFNTVGSLAGSLLSIFVLVPAIGIKGTLILCAALVAVPAFLFLAQGRGAGKTAVLILFSVLIFALFVASAQLDIPRSILARLLLPGESIEYLKEGPSSTVWISNNENSLRKIWIDNLWVSSTSKEGTHALLAHYPILFHHDPKKVAGIAFGTGQTFGACLLYPIEKIDCVEIDPVIIEACRGRFTRENHGILESPRASIIIDDGRFFLGGTREKYDIVTSEPLQPYTRGTVNLYSFEFYQACKRTLLPGGVVAQWLPVYNSGVRDTWSLIRTFAESFRYVYFFLNASDGILLGSDKEMKIVPSKPLPDGALADLSRIEDVSVYALAGNFICSRDALLRASADYPIITDDHPTLEFTAPISHWNEDVTGPIQMRRQFLTLLEPIEPLFTGPVNWDLARRFRESRRLINEGFIHEEGEKNLDAAYRCYLGAYRANPDDIKAIKSLFFLLRKMNRMDLLPPELGFLARPPVRRAP
jgi:spermidine synthase